MYFPVGPSTLNVSVTYSHNVYSQHVYFHGFTFSYLRGSPLVNDSGTFAVTSPTTISAYGGVVEGEHYELTPVQSSGPPLMTWAGNDTTYRSDRHVSLFKSDRVDQVSNSRFVSLPNSTTDFLAYTIEVVAGGSYQMTLRAQCNAASGGFNYQVFLERGEINRFTFVVNPPQTYTSVYLNCQDGNWIHGAGQFSSLQAGFYTLHLFGSPNKQILVDYISFEPLNGPFEGRTVLLPNRIECWRFDYNSYTEPNALPNTGTVQTLRYGTSADIYRDGNGNYTLGDVVNEESMRYTVRVGDPGIFDIVFIGETMGTNVRFEILFNGSYMSGILLIPAAGVYSDTDSPAGERILASVSLPSGTATITMRSLSERGFRFMTAIRFIRPAQQSVSRPFNPDNGLLPSTRILAHHYDHGGASIAFGATGASANVNALLSRSGSVFNEISSGGQTALNLSSSTCTFIQYTFRVRSSGHASIALNWHRASPIFGESNIPASARMAFEEVNPVTGGAVAMLFFNTQSTLSSSLVVSVFGQTFLNRSKMYRVTLSNFSTVGCGISAIDIDMERIVVLGASCYEFNSLISAGCVNVMRNATTCSLHNEIVPFPGLTSAEHLTCRAAAKAGSVQRFAVPVLSTKQPYAAAHVLLSVEDMVGPTEALSVPKSFKVGETMFETAIAKVVVGLFSFGVYQTSPRKADGSNVLVGEPLWQVTNFTCSGPLSSIRWDPTSRTAQLSAYTDSGQCNRFYFNHTDRFRHMWLDGCILRISNLSPATHASANATVRSGTVNVGRACDHTVDSVYNKVEAEYSSGRIETVGSFVVDTDMPHGANVAFRFVGSPLPGKPTSNCANRSFTNGLPIASVPLSPRAGETVASIRVVSYDNYRRVLVAGLAWVGTGEECLLPIYPNITAIHHRARAMTFGSTVPAFTVSSVSDCAVMCETNLGCNFYQYTERTITKSCIFLNSLSKPTALFDSTTATTIIGSAPRTLAPLVWLSPTTQPNTMHRAGDFLPVDGWTSIVFFVTRGTTFSVSVAGADALAAAAPRYLFTKETDWITLSHPHGMKQYGNAFNAFDNDGSIDGTISPSCTSLSRMVTTGTHTVPKNPITGAVYLTFGHFLGAPAQCGTTKIGLAALYVRGTIAPARAPALNLVTVHPLTNTYFEESLRLGNENPLRYISELKDLSATHTFRTINHNSIACSFFTAAGFDRHVGVKSTSSTCLTEYTLLSLEDLAKRCEADSNCEGFSTMGATGVTETGACLATSPLTTTLSDSVFYRRRRPNSTPCMFKTVAPSSAIKIEVSLSDFALPNQFITVSIGGETFARCGGRFGFVDQAPASGNCKSFAVCYDGPLFVPEGMAVQVSMSHAVMSIGCVSTEVVMSFRSAGTYLTGFPAMNFGAQRNGLWMQPFTFGSLLPRTHSISVANMSTFSAFIQDERLSFLNTSTSRFSFTVKDAVGSIVPGLSFSCTQGYMWSKSFCDHSFFHCKSRFGNVTATGSTDYVDRFAAIPFATITTSFAPFATQDCGMTTGLIIHDGTPLSVPVNNDYVRTRYVVFMPENLAAVNTTSTNLLTSGTVPWINLTQANAAAIVLGRPSATLDVIPRLFHFAPYFRDVPIGRSYTAALVDIPGIATDNLKWNLYGVNGTACIIDAFNGRKRRVCT